MVTISGTWLAITMVAAFFVGFSEGKKQGLKDKANPGRFKKAVKKLFQVFDKDEDEEQEANEDGSTAI